MNRSDRRALQRDTARELEAHGTMPAVLRVAETSAKSEAIDGAGEVRERVASAFRSLLQSPAFAQQLRGLVEEAASDIAREILAEDLPGLEDAVKRIVAEQWEASVAAASRKVLEERLAKIARRMVDA